MSFGLLPFWYNYFESEVKNIMFTYICNKQADDKGLHEVHVSTCKYLPSTERQLVVGEYSSCHAAIQSLEEANAGRGFKFDGCYYCCKPCHHG
ncbi:hypothetical protein [Enterococcus faecalis]|uniref:hypothetical protein n=1 Tax=Enterococcus faecalis TaxID=1351 RepID=UPI003D1F1D01